MDVRTSFIIAIGVLLFTIYYLEKEMEREQIFWLFAVLGVGFGMASVYTVAKKSASFQYYITFAVLFILIAIFYYEEEKPAETKAKVKEKPKAKEVKVKKKRKTAGKKK